jgi:glucan phosphoethanolaminetransferase (alkaline phosphatase superfamily)
MLFAFGVQSVYSLSFSIYIFKGVDILTQRLLSTSIMTIFFKCLFLCTTLCKDKKTTLEGLLTLFVEIIISASIINIVFTTTSWTTTTTIMAFAAQDTTNATMEKSNCTEAAEQTVNQTGAATSKTTQGVQTAINETEQFVGNVSERAAENPIVTNITGETQKFFADESK